MVLISIHIAFVTSAIITLISIFVCIQIHQVNAGLHTNEFAVQILGSMEEADKLASLYGFINKGQIGSLTSYYSFVHNHVQKRSTEPSVKHTNMLKSDPNVLWCEQQKVLTRVKRSSSKMFPSFSDPLYKKQWFLNGGSFGGYDMNVIPAWQAGFTGKGVVVSILDDGIQTDHPDLKQNYDKDASRDINGDDDDPTPRDNGDNKHGTRCAGEVAATAYNEFCGVGIAYNASIGGVRMLDGAVTDLIEASALSLKPDHIDIYSASWGPEDDGKTVDGPGPLATVAFLEGIKKGRGGLGSIYVWASGNGGRYGDSCNCDGYTNSIYTISISSATQSGRMPWYLEQCSSTLATTYSSGATDTDEGIVTVDIGYSYPRDPQSICTENHTGTSASAPIAAGICALTLEANPNLTWRDMQYLVVITSRYEPLSKEEGWTKNGAERRISPKFGYGLMDASAMVKMARRWKALPEQHVCAPPADTIEKLISSAPNSELVTSLNTTNCRNTENAVFYLEHVQVKMTLFFKPRGNLKISLISPSKTNSTMLLPRPRDSEKEWFKDWPFMSVHFWGEDPSGLWTLIITNSGEIESGENGRLVKWSLIFYGTEQAPAIVKKVKKTKSVQSYAFPTRGVSRSYHDTTKPCSEFEKFEFRVDGYVECTDKCHEGFYGDRQDFICRPCDKSCQLCYGPSYDNCLLCQSKLVLLKNICVKSCPSGYFTVSSFMKNVINRYCSPCSSACETCQDSFEKCSSCKQGLYLYKQRCLPTCPSETYSHMFTCVDCHRSCASCTGPLSTNCLSCKRDSYLFNSTCASECPEGFYESKDYACVSCHRSCKYCESSTRCEKCKPNWQPELSGKCILKNWSKKGGLTEVSSMEDCGENCDQCPSFDVQQCALCSKGFYWLDGKCVRTCPKGTFQRDDECAKCSEMCSKCTGSGIGKCLGCKDDFPRHNASCVTQCPNNYYNLNGECVMCDATCNECSYSHKNCTHCSPGHYLIDNSCLNQCPVGFFPKVAQDIRECLPCHHQCQRCSGAGSMDCINCYDNSSLIDEACIPCLDNEFFNLEKKKCERCHAKCGRCYGPLDRNCLSCQAPLRLEEIKHNCLSCCDTSEDKNDKCCTCSKDLDVCISSAGSHPRSIDRGSYASQDYEIAIPLRHVVPIIIAICASSVALFVILFGILQANSMGWCSLKFIGRHYQRVPSNIAAKFDAEMEKVSLTQEDLEEEDDIYEKA